MINMVKWNKMIIRNNYLICSSVVGRKEEDLLKNLKYRVQSYLFKLRWRMFIMGRLGKYLIKG